MDLPNSNGDSQTQSHHTPQNRQSQLKAFDDTNAGVKGLADAGVSTLPPIFLHPPQNLKDISDHKSSSSVHLELPVIDLDGIDEDPEKHKKILDRILDASRTWGFFQVVNHGIPVTTLEEALDGVRRFHEQQVEMKKPYYTRDYTKKMLYNSNFDLYSAPAACWRDSFNYIAAPDPPQPEELPEACREILLEYSKLVMNLGITMLKLISEALGLNRNHLVDIDCARTLALFGHYYPACPEPDRTLGTMTHSDYSFLTILLQDNLGGLQVLHQDHWVDVVPLSGALVVNIGDLLQLISNGEVKSVEHRVLANRCGPRVSLAAFFGRDTSGASSRVYGPIEELLSEENRPKYRATTLKDYTTYFRNKGCDGLSALRSLEI